MKKITLLAVLTSMMLACTKMDQPMITLPENTDRGIQQAAALWTAADGTEQDFWAMVEQYKIGYLDCDSTADHSAEREALYHKLSNMLETLYGAGNMVTVELTKPVILPGDELTDVDYLISEYSPLAHVSDDLFRSKIAFITILNFPAYTLAEKDSLGRNWTRLEWAYARLGDVFTSRVPARIAQQVNSAYMEAENYISEYNIMMGHLLTEDDRRLFPEDMVLLSHWNLRDELKTHYNEGSEGQEKQEMIYQVMTRIVDQSIPRCVINDARFNWHPYSNTVGGSAKPGEPLVNPHLGSEPDTRYQMILNQFHTFLQEDRYHPTMPNAIQRNFEGGMQVSDTEIRSLFTRLISSEEVKGVAAIIQERLGRDLRPYDIWYDGFKARSTMSEDKLTAQTRRLYPTAEAFHQDMPRLLQNLGLCAEDARYYRDHIVVEPARGSGHAWECEGKRWGDPARLRTRIGSEGMDYKGFNIAVHEFGHNVEQVTSLYRMDHYMLRSVPNTGFTEAHAFLYQNRDLQLLGYGDYQADDEAMLDNFWSMYEIMGVSLVDMQMWQWLYAHPEAKAAELKAAVLEIAREVWNEYYEPVLGEHDCILLAIYSHMVDAPMYLPNYPYGHLVHFQLEEHYRQFSSKEAFAAEDLRIYRLGKLTPNAWMRQAVGEDVSVEPVLRAIRAYMEK